MNAVVRYPELSLLIDRSTMTIGIGFDVLPAFSMRSESFSVPFMPTAKKLGQEEVEVHGRADYVRAVAGGDGHAGGGGHPPDGRIGANVSPQEEGVWQARCGQAATSQATRGREPQAEGDRIRALAMQALWRG